MADTYGGTELPAIVPNPTDEFPPVIAPGDPLLGYLGDFLKSVMEFHCADLWASMAPNTPIVKLVSTDSPEAGFNEQWLPTLFVFRPGRETREVIETFEQVADDYRFQKGRLAVRWIMPAADQQHRRRRDQIIDTLRKAIDAVIHIGRHPSWIVPGDTDALSPTYDSHAALEGSSLLIHSGAAVIELDHAGPGTYEHKMMHPAPSRFYEELKMSFMVEELWTPDLDLIGEPNNEAKATIISPDQGTGLGPFVLGDAIYE